MERDCLGWWEHDAVCRGCFVELCTGDLYGFANPCHPNKCYKKCQLEKVNVMRWGLVLDGLGGT